MFNTPRQTQRYGTSGSLTANNGFGSASFMGDDPLANSTYDGLDPWSSAPSPDIPPPPSSAPPSPFASVLDEAKAPSLYQKAFSVVNPSGTGETSISSLSRVLLTSGVSASTIDRIVNLVSSRPRVSKLEFFVALALVALAQTGKDISIEQVASLAAQDALPVPSLDLGAIAPATSTFSSRRDSMVTSPHDAMQPTYSSDDPWQRVTDTNGGNASLVNGAPSSVSGTGLPREWWRRQERVQVQLIGMQGFILKRYMLYAVASDRGTPVSRRYSEFAFLWDCLVRRYPFRLLPQLPPKRIGPDESFLEQRRRGLQRFLNFVVNHPVIKEDGLLAVFLTEPSLEQWRKHNAISLEEEPASKRLDKVEEMAIPSDLEDKLKIVRNKLSPVIEQWQKICILAERLIKRREAAAVRNPHAIFRRSFLSSVMTPSIPSSSSAASPTSSPPASPVSMVSSVLPVLPSVSVFGSFASAPIVGSARPDGSADGGFYTSYWEDSQADLSRLTISLNALNEVNAQCWRGDDCELCSGVRSGLEQVSNHIGKQSDNLDQRARVMSLSTLEALKSQRDLYIAMRDLFLRHDRLSSDNVERLKKRIETTQSKLEGIRVAQKDGWEQEVDRLSGLVEHDQATIASLLNRRIFIRYSMWHELRVVLHNRENTLITQVVREFTRDESAFAEVVSTNWNSLAEAVENMPYE
ncbi:MVP1 [Sanghuangporus vaninii]